MTIQPQPRRRNHHRLFSCHRHPAATPVTGLCASCLRERLAGIQSQSPTSTAPVTTTPQLRRSKSCSGGPNPPSSSASEPRRKSCDARAHRTLHDLFAVDDRIEDPNPNPNSNPRPKPKLPPPDVRGIASFQDLDEEGEFKTMKELIDLETGAKKSSRKSIWEAASVFSKKLGKWRRKQEKKKENSDRLEQCQPLSSRRLREIQSEIGEYGLGRRSCDTEPGLSVDIGRLSVDDPRVYFEPPRASWDGYLIGKQNQRPEDANAGGEERLSVVEEEKSPGGTTQTKDYYADSLISHRRRTSFDRAVLNRKTVLLGEAEDLKSSISNAKVSPETVGLFHGAKLLVTEKELRDSNWYSLKEYKTQSVESGYKNVEFVASEVSKKGYDSKKLPKWKNLLNILGLIQKRKETDCGCEDRSVGGDVENESLVESLQKLKMMRRGASGRKDWSVEGNMVNEKLFESLQSVRRSSNAEEDRGIEGNVGEETLAESLQKVKRASNAEEDRGIEGKVVETTLAESLQKLKMASNAEDDREVGGETLAESLQQLKRASNAEEDRGIEGNVGEETLAESLIKLRRASNAEEDRDIGDSKASIGSQKLRRSYSVSGRNPSKVEGASHGTTTTTTTSAQTRVESEKKKDNPVLQKNSSVRHLPNPESGLLRFHLAPLRSYRRSKSGKSRLKNTLSAGLNVS